MENAEEIMHSLEEFSKLKPKDIPRELEDYLGYVAKTGDPVFKWSIIKCLFREKLLNVITDFYESTLSIELPPCPNVDPFNYERMKANLLEKLDSFSGAPFTVQRISELLTNPWKEYNRADKFMRAIEKNILVVSTREPGRYAENDTDSQQDSSFNGIPGPNESGLESSFSCNDLADADSSSQQYELNQEAQSTLVSGVNSNITSVTFKENGENIGDSACPNDIGIIRNDEVSQEIIIEEKDTETVICSTVTPQSTEELPQNENVPEKESSATDLSTPSESTMDSSVDSNTPDNKDIAEERKEALLLEVSATETVVDSIQTVETKPPAPVVDSSEANERLNVVSNSNDSSEESSESSSSQTFEESRPGTTECDTSNSFDSETSSSCDSEVEAKNQEEQSSAEGIVTKAADSTEINEAASTCSYVECDTKDDKPDQPMEQETVTTCESTEMDVGECPLPQADQSET